jgi:hypothetical protein
MINAADNLAVETDSVYPPGSTAWSITSSDSKYGSSGGSATNIPDIRTNSFNAFAGSNTFANVVTITNANGDATALRIYTADGTDGGWLVTPNDIIGMGGGVQTFDASSAGDLTIPGTMTSGTLNVLNSGSQVVAKIDAVSGMVTANNFVGNGIGLSSLLPMNRHYDAIVMAGSSISNALANIVDASSSKRYMLYVTNGIYGEMLVPKSYVDIVGQSQAGVIITNSVNNSTVNNVSGTAGGTFMIANLTVQQTWGDSTNAKYAIHLDQSLVGDPGRPKSIGGFSPAEMVLYNVTATAQNTSALGIGLWAYQRLYVVNCTLIDTNETGVFLHNNTANGGQIAPCAAYFINDTVVGYSGAQGYGLRYGNIGSGQSDFLQISGGSYVGSTNIWCYNIAGGGGTGETFYAFSPSYAPVVQVDAGNQLAASAIPSIPSPNRPDPGFTEAETHMTPFDVWTPNTGGGPGSALNFRELVGGASSNSILGQVSTYAYQVGRNRMDFNVGAWNNYNDPGSPILSLLSGGLVSFGSTNFSQGVPIQFFVSPIWINNGQGGAGVLGELAWAQNVVGGNSNSIVGDIQSFAYDNGRNRMDFRVGDWNNSSNAGPVILSLVSGGQICVDTTNPSPSGAALNVNGSVIATNGYIEQVSYVNGSYAFFVHDCIVLETASTNSLIVLSLATSIPGGYQIVKNVGNGICNVSAPGGETINGVSSLNLSANQSSRFSSDGTNWVTTAIDYAGNFSGRQDGLTNAAGQTIPQQMATNNTTGNAATATTVTNVVPGGNVASSNGTFSGTVTASNLTAGASTFTGQVMNTNATTGNYALYDASKELRTNAVTGSYFLGTNGSGNWFSGSQSVTISNGQGVFSGQLTTAGITNTALTPFRVKLTGVNDNEVSAAASGAVPINADGSATTGGQLTNLLTALNAGQLVGSFPGSMVTGPTTVTNGLAGLAGVGTVNHIAKFSSGNAIVNSSVIENSTFGSYLLGTGSPNILTNYGNVVEGYANAQSATTIGTGNSFQGYANAYSATAIGTGNSFQGYANAYSATAIGTGNSLQGNANAYFATTIGTGNVLLGMSSESPYGGTLSGILNIGSLIFGNGMNTLNAPSYGPSGGKLGVNTTNLVATFNVGGSVIASGSGTFTNGIVLPSTNAYINWNNIGLYSPPSSGAASSFLFSGTNILGTAEIFTMDGAGVVKQISEHAMDAPPSMLDDSDPFPNVDKEWNDYLGVVRWINRSREALVASGVIKLNANSYEAWLGIQAGANVALLANNNVWATNRVNWAQSAMGTNWYQTMKAFVIANAAQQEVTRTETYADYNTRLGLTPGMPGYLQTRTWTSVQDGIQAAYATGFTNSLVNYTNFMVNYGNDLVAYTNALAFYQTNVLTNTNAIAPIMPIMPISPTWTPPAVQPVPAWLQKRGVN